MTWIPVLLGLLALVAVLWLAYNIGKVVLRIAVGLAVLGLVSYVIWSFATHGTLTLPF